MSKYMKNKFIFYGIKSPLRKKITKKYLDEIDVFSHEEGESVIRLLWQEPYRELHYFALDFIELIMKKNNQEIIFLLEWMIIRNSWWDSIDPLATKILGSYFNEYPDQIKNITTKWMATKNIWLQRCCLLFQLKYKDRTNIDLLASFIFKLSNSKEFFIQKSIGWSLREYAKTNPEWVLNFTESNFLMPLSKREALKYLK